MRGLNVATLKHGVEGHSDGALMMTLRNAPRILDAPRKAARPAPQRGGNHGSASQSIGAMRILTLPCGLRPTPARYIANTRPARCATYLRHTASRARGCDNTIPNVAAIIAPVGASTDTVLTTLQPEYAAARLEPLPENPQDSSLAEVLGAICDLTQLAQNRWSNQ